jgi:CubicO group peptidase (beta-lactamase class C family)
VAHERRSEAEVSERVDAALNLALREKRIVGAVFLAARDGKTVIRRAVGLADREAGRPMHEDALFRWASLTKPVLVLATLRLMDRGDLALDTEVSRWLPEFRPKLGASAPAITVRHLLTHTSGLGYAFFEPGDGPYHRAGISDGLDASRMSVEENLRRLASVPLNFAPGTAFLYSLSMDVLGAMISRVTGTPLPDLIQALVTGPLGMPTAGFHAPAGIALATPYADGSPEPVRMHDGIVVPFAEGGVTFAPSRIHDPGAYPSGGGGMRGDAADFLRFLEALRTQAPLASPYAYQEMFRDQIPAITSSLLGDAWGYGYGVAVLRDPVAAGVRLHHGAVRWGGAFGNSWWIDPEDGVSAVLLTNTAFEGMNGQIRTDLQEAMHG